MRTLSVNFYDSGRQVGEDIYCLFPKTRSALCVSPLAYKHCRLPIRVACLFPWFLLVLHTGRPVCKLADGGPVPLLRGSRTVLSVSTGSAGLTFLFPLIFHKTSPKYIFFPVSNYALHLFTAGPELIYSSQNIVTIVYLSGCFRSLVMSDDTANVQVQAFVWTCFLRHLGMDSWRHVVTLCLTFVKLSHCLPKWLHYFTV